MHDNLSMNSGNDTEQRGSGGMKSHTQEVGGGGIVKVWSKLYFYIHKNVKSSVSQNVTNKAQV